MSVTFTKLFSSITESTVWCEPSDTRIVWITMLAMADRHGRVFGSVPGLANRSQVSVDAARTALAVFLEPDPDSRTKDHDGRRIAEMDGGWVLLNHGKYRAITDEVARKAYKADHERRRRAKAKAETGNETKDSVDNHVDNVDKRGLRMDTKQKAESRKQKADTDKYKDLSTTTVRKRTAKSTVAASIGGSDPRRAEVVDQFDRAFKHFNPTAPQTPWSGLFWKRLDGVLANLSKWTVDDFRRAIANRYKSEDVNISDPPENWVVQIAKYLGGPLDRFGNLPETKERRTHAVDKGKSGQTVDAGRAYLEKEARRLGLGEDGYSAAGTQALGG